MKSKIAIALLSILCLGQFISAQVAVEDVDTTVKVGVAPERIDTEIRIYPIPSETTRTWTDPDGVPRRAYAKPGWTGTVRIDVFWEEIKQQ